MTDEEHPQINNGQAGDAEHEPNLRHSSLTPNHLPDPYPFDADGALCREFLLERGYCCGNGCRNCPYDEA